MVICDTNIIIELYRGNATIAEKCLEIGVNNLYISDVTLAEFIVGANNKEDYFRILKHINKFKILSFEKGIGDIFRDIYPSFALSHKPEIPDMLIAATALHYQCKIYTLNIRHFKFIDSIQLI